MEQVGKKHVRVDGFGKVTGRASFADDIKLPDMLYGAVVIAKQPHARIISIDKKRAERLKGVVCVITAQDLKFAKTFGIVIKNQPVLADRVVRYWGDAVAIVVAETLNIARKGAGLVGVKYQQLPVVSDPLEAMQKDSIKIHEGGNILVHHKIRKGDVKDGFEKSDVVVEKKFETQRVEHSYIEPECVVAIPEDDGGVKIIGCIQNLFSTRRSTSEVCGLPLSKVVIVQSAIGGSFGGKDEVMTQLACRAAVCALKTLKPVKIAYSREESMAQSYKRHPYILCYRIGAKRDGSLQAIEAKIIADAGAYASMTPFVTWRSAVQATGPYRCPNVKVDVYGVYTNNCYTGAMRGFGSPQVNFAIEGCIDALAERLGMDPVELRLKIAFEDGSITATGQRLTEKVTIKEVLKKAEKISGWKKRKKEFEKENAQSRSSIRKGIGIACAFRGVSLGAEGVDATGANVSIQTDGTVIIQTGLTEMGQGSHTTMAIIAGEILAVPVEKIKFVEVRTDRVADSGPTVASRGTVMFGQSVKMAAKKLRDRLEKVAREVFKEKSGGIEFKDGMVYPSGKEDKKISFEQLVSKAYQMGVELCANGWFKAPATTWNEETGQGDAYFTYVYGANVAEVEVDTETGKVNVKKFYSVHDLGRAVNPQAVKSQIYGGVAMGIGYGILENYVSVDGVPKQHNFDEYLIATSMDMPEEMECVIVESIEKYGPFGAKSIGEPATEIVAPAICNAIYHATGRRITSLPADLETVAIGRKLVKTVQRSSLKKG